MANNGFMNILTDPLASGSLLIICVVRMRPPRFLLLPAFNYFLELFPIFVEDLFARWFLGGRLRFARSFSRPLDAFFVLHKEVGDIVPIEPN